LGLTEKSGEKCKNESKEGFFHIRGFKNIENKFKRQFMKN